MSFLARAAQYAGRNFLGTRAVTAAAYAGAAAVAAAAASQTARADKNERSVRRFASLWELCCAIRIVLLSC
jgi:NADH:ubiquinone oxidoreductase subunit 6 (subunit J)